MSDADPNNAMSGHDRTEPAAGDYTLTIEEASELFAEAGVPRNPRSIRRFCQNRQLDCISIETPTSNRYLISRSSAEKLIVEKQQAMRFAVDHRPLDTSGHNRLEPAMSGHDRTRPDIHTVEREAASEDSVATIKRLEDENLNLRIDNRAKEQVITLLRDERHEIQKQFQEVSYRLGAAETRVAQLQAPQDNDNDVSGPRDGHYEMPDIERSSGSSETPPKPSSPQPFWPNAE